MNLRIFVLTTFYNSPAALAKCLRSIDSQSIDFHCVLVNDGSAQPASMIAREIVTDSCRFELIERAIRQGPAAARAEGMGRILELSNNDSDIVVLVDGDDYLVSDQALAAIRRSYEEVPATQMTFGGTVRLSGWEPTPYSKKVLDRGWAHHLPTWSAPHPRTFRTGLFRRSRQDFRFRLPTGRWLQGATDQALIFPMLAKCRSEEVTYIPLPLYYYRTTREDGLTLHDSPQGRLEQWLGEHFVRASLAFSIFTFLRQPKKALSNLGLLGRRLLNPIID